MNPLFAVAVKQHKADLEDGDFLHITDTPASEGIYTLGFFRGVSYSTEIFTKKIEALQKIVAELQNNL